MYICVMNIRELTTIGVENIEARNLMEKFWEAYDKLFIDMDNLTYEEFLVRQHEMWEWRNKASDIYGDYFLLTLGGLSNKAILLYGKDGSEDYFKIN